MAEETPVLIAGAGPSGLALAVTLACRGIKAMLIDRAERGQETSRAIVLHAGSVPFVRRRFARRLAELPS